MILLKHIVRETHYDILHVKEDASYEEIRASYRAAVLNSHPDKLLKTTTTSDSDKEKRERFLKVQKAWEILSNSCSRAVYDQELRGSRHDIADVEAAEDIELKHMMIEDHGESLVMFYQCQCGDFFSIDSLELGKMGYFLSMDGSKISVQTPDGLPASFLLSCGSCSLKARLLMNLDSKFSNNEHL